MAAIKDVAALPASVLARAYEAAAGASAPQPAQSGFAQTLASMVGDVDRLQDHSAEVSRSMVAGEATDVHEVMVAVEESSLAFSLMVEIRNKLLEAYQELMRMQV